MASFVVLERISLSPGNIFSGLPEPVPKSAHS